MDSERKQIAKGRPIRRAFQESESGRGNRLNGAREASDIAGRQRVERVRSSVGGKGAGEKPACDVAFHLPHPEAAREHGILSDYSAYPSDHAKGNGNPSPSSGQARKAKSDISIYGQESNYTTWRLAKMNLAIRGIDGQIAHGDTFHNDRHADLKADFILANPPFNISDWGGERLRDDKRWKYGAPPAGNAPAGQAKEAARPPQPRPA